MPTIPTSKQSIDGTVGHSLDTTGYTWSDTRDASTGSGLVSINPTVMGPEAYKQTGGRGNLWKISRDMLSFNFSGVTGTITQLNLKLYKSTGYTSFKDVIVIKNSNTWDSSFFALTTADYNVDFSTPYSAEYTMPTGGSGTLKTISLNSDAKADAVGNANFNLAICDHTYDFSDVDPTGLSNDFASFYYNNSSYYPRLEYTLDTGYGEIVNGVIAANINKIKDVVRLNVSKVIDTPYSSTSSWSISDITTGGSKDITSLINGSNTPANIQPYVDPTGTKLYVVEYTNKKIRQLSISTAHDLSSTIANVGISSALTTSFTHFQMSSDGTKAYIRYNSSIVQYTLSTAWNITTMATTGTSLSFLVPFGGYPKGLHFSPDGTELTIVTVDSSPNQVNIVKWDLSTAWSLSTAGTPSYNDITTTGPNGPITIGSIGIMELWTGETIYMINCSATDDTLYEDGVTNADFKETDSLTGVEGNFASIENGSHYLYYMKRLGGTSPFTWTIHQKVLGNFTP